MTLSFKLQYIKQQLTDVQLIDYTAITNKRIAIEHTVTLWQCLWVINQLRRNINL